MKCQHWFMLTGFNCEISLPASKKEVWWGDPQDRTKPTRNVCTGHSGHARSTTAPTLMKRQQSQREPGATQRPTGCAFRTPQFRYLQAHAASSFRISHQQFVQSSAAQHRHAWVMLPADGRCLTPISLSQTRSHYDPFWLEWRWKSVFFTIFIKILFIPFFCLWQSSLCG